MNLGNLHEGDRFILASELEAESCLVYIVGHERRDGEVRVFPSRLNGTSTLEGYWEPDEREVYKLSFTDFVSEGPAVIADEEWGLIFRVPMGGATMSRRILELLRATGNIPFDMTYMGYTSNYRLGQVKRRVDAILTEAGVDLEGHYAGDTIYLARTSG